MISPERMRQIRIERHREIGIVVGYSAKCPAHLDLDAQFFPHFPPEAFLGRFPGLDLPSRKLPLERHAHGRTSLGGQDPAVLFDDRAGYVNSIEQSWNTGSLRPIFSLSGFFISCIVYPKMKPKSTKTANIVSLIRPEVRALTAYHVDETPVRIKLDAMENPFSLPDAGPQTDRGSGAEGEDQPLSRSLGKGAEKSRSPRSGT